MARSKLILVWGNVYILSSAIEHLLEAKEDWQVISISNQEDLSELLLAVKNTKPDIVILHWGEDKCVKSLPAQLLQANSAIKVITINLDNNWMDVYSKQNIWVKQASDLISAIESDYSSQEVKI